MQAGDLFSFTAAGRPFVSQNWLASLLYHAICRAGGLEAVVALNALVLTAALAFSFRSALEEAVRLRPAIAGAAFAASGLIFQRNMRPQTFSFLFFALVLWIALRMRRGQRVPWWLAPAAMALWVNIHGAFVLGLVVTAIILAGDLLERRKVSWQLSSTLLLMIGATVLNPVGPKIYAAVWEVASDRSSQLFVQEWLAPEFGELHSTLAFFVPLAAVILGLLLSRRKPRPVETLLLLAFAAFAFTARRNAIWFSLAAAPVMAAHFSTIPFAPGRGSESRAANLGIAGALLVLTVLLSPWVYPRLGVAGLGLTLLERRTPVRGVDYLERQRITGRIFHPQEYGDYIIWRLWPMQRTFIDSRVHLFDDALIEDYIRVGRASSDWEQILARHRIEWILLSPADREHHRLIRAARASNGWRVAFSDGRNVLFQRVSPR